MDLDDFWQENKRWVLGCVAGLLVFVIANSIVGDSGRSGKRVGSLGERYNRKQLTAVKEDKKELDATLAALRTAMHFELPEEYKRQGDPHVFWTTTYDRVRRNLFDMARNADVEFPETAFAWTASDPAIMDRSLVGCCVVEHLVTQLLEAHQAVTDADFESIGVRSIGVFTQDRGKAPRRTRRREGDPVRPEELLSEVKVGFKFEADHATVHRFVENCRSAGLRVNFGNLKVTLGRRAGDPLMVSGEMIALTIKPIPTEDI